MTITLPARVARAFEFHLADEKRRTDWWNMDAKTYEDNETPNIEEEFVSGAKHENARLLPLLNALMELIEPLEGVRRFVHVSGEASNNIVYENACMDHVSEIDKALSRLDEVLKEYEK